MEKFKYSEGWSRFFRIWIMILPLGMLIGGCAAEEEEYVERPVAEFYNEAADTMAAGDYAAAITLFQEVERQHPYSQWASQAQIMIAYAHYRELEYDEAIAALDRFIELHPGSSQIAYAYYLRALCYYEQIVDVGRDQANTTAASGGFEEVIRRFPETDYARDARFKLVVVYENLAGKEMEIGRFYLWREKYHAAIQRFRVVVEDFQNTSHPPEALHRLIESYLALGVIEEARMILKTLELNFPDSSWYRDSYILINGQAPPSRPEVADLPEDNPPEKNTSEEDATPSEEDNTSFVRQLLQRLFSYIF